MDVRCRKCGEPWDMDCLHAAVDERHGFDSDSRPRGETYQRFFAEVSADFRNRGCAALGGKCSAPEEPGPDGLTMGEKAGILYDLLGDDMDGAAAMLEDLE